LSGIGRCPPAQEVFVVLPFTTVTNGACVRAKTRATTQ
jgi:hypothetical protein